LNLHQYHSHFCFKLELWVTSLSDTPHLQYYDVQTLEYRYISKLPMKNERIWSYVKETTSHLQNKLTKNMKLYTFVVHNLQMCMKEYRCCLKFRRGDNSTYAFTKRGVVYLWRPLDVCSWLVYFGDGMLSLWHNSISVHFS
jgi:hypothetical protein